MKKNSPQSEAHARHIALNKDKHRIVLPSLLLGLLSALVAVGFRGCLSAGESLRSSWVEQLKPYGATGFCFTFAGVFALIGLAAWLVRRFCPEASGSGIPHLKGVVSGYRHIKPVRLLLTKFSSGCIGISAGMALGREGPTVQMGGALGALMAKLWGFENDKSLRQTLISAGSAAGLSGAFNAPLSGLTFIIEELGITGPVAFFSTALACLVADIVCRSIMGQLPLLEVDLPNPPNIATLPSFLLIGIFCGFAGIAFNRLLLVCSAVAGRLRAAARYGFLLLMALALAWFAWRAPNLAGTGQQLLDETLRVNGRVAWGIPILLMLARLLLTLGSYSTGSAGGIFSPVLILGALAGIGVNSSVEGPWIGELPSNGAAALVGMSALFASVARAPLTAIILTIEMTGAYSIIIPLFISTFVASFIADALNELPIYEALLERDLNQRKHRSPIADGQAR